MDNTTISPETRFSESFADDYVHQTRIHLNFDQNVIIVTEDRLELCLRKHLECIDFRKAWITPVSLAAAFITTLITSTFKNSLGLSASTWQAFFVFLLLASLVWSLITIVKAISSKSTVRMLLDEIKKISKAPTENIKNGD